MFHLQQFLKQHNKQYIKTENLQHMLATLFMEFLNHINVRE